MKCPDCLEEVPDLSGHEYECKKRDLFSPEELQKFEAAHAEGQLMQMSGAGYLRGLGAFNDDWSPVCQQCQNHLHTIALLQRLVDSMAARILTLEGTTNTSMKNPYLSENSTELSKK